MMAVATVLPTPVATVLPSSMAGVVPTATMNFTENQQGNTILEKLMNQREAGRFCDVILHVQGQKFQAHRNVLAACSPYFDSVLKMHKTIREQLTITCQNLEAFQLLLNYMYTGAVVVDKSNVTELLRLSNHFLIGRLKNYCVEYLDRYMDVNNCLTVREMAEKYAIPELQKSAINFMQNHISEVVEQEEVLQYNLQKVEAFLSDRNWMIPLSVLLKFITRWINFDLTHRQSDLRTLLTFIDWHLLERSVLEEHLKSEKLYQENPRCLYLFLECLEENKIDIPSYKSVYKDLKSEYDKTNTNVDNDSFINIAISAAIQGLQQLPLSSSTEESVCGPITVTPLEKDISKCESVVDTEEQSSGARSSKSSDLGVSDTSPKIVTSRGRVVQQPLKLRFASQRLVSVLARRGPKRKVGRPRKIIALSAPKQMYKRPVGRPPKRRYVSESESQDEDDEINHSDSDESIRGSDEDHGQLSLSWKEGVKCPLCSYLAYSSVRLEQHVSRVHSKDVTYKCKICEFTCKWNREYYSHMKAHFRGPPFRCEHCDYTCDRIQFLLSHRMRHTDERPFKCEECNHRCRSKANLDAHMRCHTGEKPYRCDHCDRRFTIKASLDQHLATHSDDRPFLCDICGFSTKYQSHLLSHKRIHSGDVFHCQFPNCRYSTPKKSQLAAHQRTHTAVRSHICAICGRGFIEKSHLVRHERIHLNEKPFKCDQCDYCSSRRDKLKEHFRKHHGENATAKGPYRPRKPRRQNFDPVVFPGRTSDAESQVHPQHIELQSAVSAIVNSSTGAPVVYNLDATHQDSLHSHAAAALQQLGAAAAHNYQMAYIDQRLPSGSQSVVQGMVSDQNQANPVASQDGSNSVNVADFTPFMSLM